MKRNSHPEEDPRATSSLDKHDDLDLLPRGGKCVGLVEPHYSSFVWQLCLLACTVAAGIFAFAILKNRRLAGSIVRHQLPRAAHPFLVSALYHVRERRSRLRERPSKEVTARNPEIKHWRPSH